jgi:hypothetical protein
MLTRSRIILAGAMTLPVSSTTSAEVLSAQGKAVKTVVTTLQPGEEKVARAGSELLGRYCKFTVAGSKSTYRASILVRQDGIGAVSALPAS